MQGSTRVLKATDDVAAVRRRAVVASSNFESDRATEALQRALHDRDWQVRQAAEDVLASIERQLAELSICGVAALEALRGTFDDETIGLEWDMHRHARRDREPLVESGEHRPAPDEQQTRLQ